MANQTKRKPGSGGTTKALPAAARRSAEPKATAAPALAPLKVPAAPAAKPTQRKTARALPIRSSPVSTERSLRSSLETLHAPRERKRAAPARRAPFARKPVLQELEARLLLSADLNPAAQDTLLAAPALQGAEFRALAQAQVPPVIVSAQVAPIQRTNELVFVDTAVPEYQKLVADMRASALADGRNLEFVLIEAGKDGVRKITDTLAQKSGLDAIHIVSHGGAGALQLGAATLDFDALVKRSGAIKKWGGALTDSGDLLIYGCDLASTAAGRSLVDALARLTGADVAASDDPTGALKKGGDWELEFRRGEVETKVVVSLPAQREWDHLLATYTVTNTNDAGAGSLREAITLANGNAGADTIAFAIAGAGVQTINLASALPTITDEVLLDGWSQGGGAYSGPPLIELNGAGIAENAGTPDAGLHLGAGSDGSTIRGFIVNRFGVGADFGDQAGIFVQNSANNVIAGNWLGTDATGLAAGGGGQEYGILVNGDGNTIGGLSAAERNVVSANDRDGIRIVNGDNNVVVGNWIGLDKDGTAELGNVFEGIHLRNSADNNTIGGTAAGARNVISGNSGGGIRISGQGTVPPVGNVVQGNYFGTDPGGTFALGAVGSGFNSIEIDNGASNNTIGGVNPGEGNVLAFSWDDNISVTDETPPDGAGPHSTGNAFLGNANFAADTDGGGDGNGIDLLRNWPADEPTGNHQATANDAGDADGGYNAPNELQNFPVLTSAVTNAGTYIVIGGSLNSLANTNFRIEFFASPDYTANGPGYREGAVYLGATHVTTDAAGNLTFNVALAGNVPAGRYITATATRANGDFTRFFETSEFSQDDEVAAAAAAGGTISGTLFEDVDGDADVSAGDGTRRLAGATVYLYENLGGAGLEGAGVDVLRQTVTTDADGNYAFIGVADATYWVAVDSKTLRPNAGYNAGATIANVWAEQTYGVAASVIDDTGATLGLDGAYYGGQNAATSDDASSAITAEHVLRATIAGGGTVGNLNAGFSFNAIVNTRGNTADDDGAGTPRLQQGSLRQFILNSNAISGVQSSEFQIGAVGSPASLALSGSELPTITDAVRLDAWTQGTGGYNGVPLVELNGAGVASADADGLTITATNGASLIRGFVVNRFTDNGILLSGATNVTVQGNYIGTDTAGNAPSSNNRDGGFDGDGIRLSGANGNTIGGLGAGERNVISGNDAGGDPTTHWEHGVYLWNSDNNLIQGNYIGTNFDGTVALRNFADGVAIDGNAGGGFSTGNVVRNNLLSGNKEYGVWVSYFSPNQVIQGNLIGTNFDGTLALGNGLGAAASPNPGAGIRLDSSGNTVGGTIPAERNVISGNLGAGIVLADAFMDGTSAADNNLISGNYIGTTADGLGDLGNGGAGVEISRGASGNTIGGTGGASTRNVIGGNSGDGVLIFGGGATNNLVQGNYIGVAANGTADLGNSQSGVYVWGGASNNTIGGGVAAAGNVISRNDRYGVELSSGTTTGNVIQANRIGTTADGTAPLGNAFAGVGLGGGANGNVIGLGYLAGAETGLGNTIAYNGGDGVELTAPNSTQGNRIAGNAIYANGVGINDLPIDLGADGNAGSLPDGNDADSGPNGYQNYPEFTATPTTDGTTLTVRGRLLTSGAIQTYRLHFYASAGLGPSTDGEGERYLGYHDLVNPVAFQLFTANIVAPVANGEYITMTATRIAGGVADTSELSGALRAASVHTISGTIYHDDEGDGAIGGDAGFAGATVKLYRDDGDNAPDGGDTFLATATTGAGGAYSFANVENGYTYWVVVDSKTLDAASIAGAVWADQTYGDDWATGGALDLGARYGGRNAGVSDDAWNGANVLQAPEHVARVDLAPADQANVDFGFSFVSVTNNRGDATDDDEPVNAGTARLQQGSLRQVILNANAIAGTQTVDFSVGTGQVTINVADAALPAINGTIFLDGRTQEGYSGTPLVMIDGGALFGLANGLTLTASADGSTIRGLIIRDFDDAGSAGIDILAGSDNNVVYGNYVGGLDFAGNDATAGEGNAAGVRVAGSNNTIGSTTLADRNLIARNAGDGIRVTAGAGNVVIGNYVGTNLAGTAALTNTGSGVYIGSGATNNTIGGTAAGTTNVISGNGLYGVLIDTSSNNRVQGNYIGTNFDATAPIGNASDGVRIQYASAGNTIGGAAPNAGNVIAGNAGSGVRISSSNVTGGDDSPTNNVVQGNWIGTNSTGTDLGNTLNGVHVQGPAAAFDSPDNNVIGTTSAGPAPNPEAGAGNVIAFNNLDGVRVEGGVDRTRIAGNSIHDNDRLGINLVGGTEDAFGITSNDVSGTWDNDAGANRLQNLPTLTAAYTDGATFLTVQGQLQTLNGTYRIHFYASAAADASMYGEGTTYLGYADVLVNGGPGYGTGVINTTFNPVVIPIGARISATATDPNGNTSEFSNARATQTLQTISGTVYDDDEGDGAVAGDGGFVGATVKLYLDDGDNTPDGGDTLVATATTGAGGTYTFANVGSGLTYWVVVDSKTLDAASIAGAVWADQTYGDDWATGGALDLGARYGGRNAGVSDNAWNGASVLQAPEHVARVDLGNADVGGADFGFSFVSVTNNRGDATDDDQPVNPGTARLQQGSLRQVILNANAIAGTQTVDFSVGTGQVTIDASAGGYTIDGTLILDATTQEGFAGTPLVLIDGNGALLNGLTLTANADGSEIRGLIVRNFVDCGIEILAGSDNNLIAGNYIGGLTFAGGDAGLAERNLTHGIRISGSNNTIGGTDPTGLDRNVLARNAVDGIFVNSGDGNVIIGNYIGTNAAGDTALANEDGIQVNKNGASIPTNTRIGGTAAGEGNLISGNVNNGIELYKTGGGGNGTGVVIQGNRIGTNAAGTAGLGNGGAGVQVIAFDAVTVGGTVAGAGNVIAYNTGDGVSANVEVVTVLGNSIFQNGNAVVPGIDFGGNFATPNDPGNPDNLPQNFPVISAVRLAGPNVEVDFSLDSDVSQAYRIEFFANPPADPNEGRVFLGFVSISTNASGLYSGTAILTPAVLPLLGDRVTATATRDLGGGNYSYTSEFSIAGTVAIPPVNTVPGSQTVNEDAVLAFTGANTISVADSDNNLATTQLTVTNGVLTVTLAGGATIGAGANGSATMTISGTQADINATLASLTYQGNLNFNGADTLTVLSTDALFGTDSDTVAITVTAVNDAPAIGNVNGDALAYSEGDGAVVIDQGALATVADVDSANFDTGTLTVSFTAGSDPAEDVLAIRNQGVGAGQIGVAGANVTYGGITIGTFAGGAGGADLVITFNANATPAAAQALVRNVTYADTDTGAPTTGARTVQFVMTDGDGGTSAAVSATVTVTGVNDAPTLTNGAVVALAGTDEDTTSSGTLVSAILAGAGWADVDAGALQGIAVTSASGTGTWQYSTDGLVWTNFGAVAANSALLLEAGSQVRYVPNGQNGETATFAFRAWDRTTGSASANGAPQYANPGAGGGTSAYSAQSASASLAVASVNDAPSLNAAAAPALAAVAEDAPAPVGAVGTLVSALVDLPGGGGLDNVTDVDSGALTGIAITATNGANGTWWYSTDGGASWLAVGAVADNNALLLAANAGTRLYFQPNADFNGTVANGITFRAWDTTSGVAGTKADASTNGGTSAFSTATDTASVTVTAVNDAPVLADTALTLTAVAEDAGAPVGAVGDLVSTLAGGISDVDGPATGIAVTGASYTGAGSGTWYYSTNNGGAWNTFVPSVASSRLLAADANTRIYFRPAANWNGTATLTIRAWDGSAGVNGGTADTTTNGGATAFSSATDTVGLAVTAVNDAPVAAGAASLGAVAEDTANPPGATVSALFGGNFSDATDAVAGGSSAHTLAGIAITANAATAGQGTWQWFDGLAWQNVSTSVSTASALLLADTTLVRFLPAADFAGAPGGLTAKLVDSSAGAVVSGTSADVTVSGGTTRYSAGNVALSTSVTAVNDAPTLTNGAVVALAGTDEDTTSSGTLVSAILAGAGWADVDAGALQGIAVTSASGTGTWQYSTDGLVWTNFGAVAANSALLLEAGSQVRYLPNGQNGETATFAFRAWDQTTGSASANGAPQYANPGAGGGTSAYSAQSASASLAVASVNDAPSLNAAAAPALAAVAEDAPAPVGAVGTLVSALVDLPGGGGLDNVTDVDSGALTGIAITATNGANGTWWYSTDGGASWLAVGAVADNNALLLAADAGTRLYFQPNADFNGTVANGITFRAWDTTSGVAGTKADASINGGTSAFSTATDTASVTVTAVNDAPVNTVPGAQTVASGATLVFASGNGNAISVADADASGNIEVQLNATNGTVSVTLAGGASIFAGANGTATITLRGTVADLNATLDGLVFAPATGYVGAGASLQIVTDDLGGSGAGGALTDTDTVAITVTGFDISGTVFHDVDGDANVAEGGTLTFSGATVNLYLDDGDGVIGGGDGLVATTMTNGAGQYGFLNRAAGTYWVVVDSTTLDSGASFLGPYDASWIWAEQTYGDDAGLAGLNLGARFGGRDANVSDNAGGASPVGSEHVAGIALGGNQAGVDFGFSFNAIVTTDDGDDVAGNRTVQGSLRQFIINSNAIDNASFGVQSAEFSIAGAGVHTIGLLDPDGFGPLQGELTITDAVILDATTQDGFVSTPLIEIDGTLAGSNSYGLRLEADNSEIRGLIINRFTQGGIRVTGDSNLIAGNWLGVDATGNADAGNGSDGVVLVGGANLNTIGGTTAADRNVVSGNTDEGISLDGATNTLVIGNYVGVGADGVTIIGNDGDGVALQFGATGNTVGGTTAAARNLIAGNAGPGIGGLANVRIKDAGTTGNVVLGNYIGVDATGGFALASPREGVRIEGGATNNTIGGAAAGAGNVISGHAGHGILLDDADGNTIQRNLIGTNAAGNSVVGTDAQPLGNRLEGIHLRNGSANNLIGGVGLGNVIASNPVIGGSTTWGGIWIRDAGSDNNAVQGNWIGTNGAGDVLGLGYNGVELTDGASYNLIGGANAGEGNVIAYAQDDGIFVYDNGGHSTGNAFLRNSIYGNDVEANGDGIGIDLEDTPNVGVYNVTPNDGGDGDGGMGFPNEHQNYPVLTAATTGSGQVNVTWSLDSVAGATFRVEFFSSPAASPSGYGEGRTFLGAVTVVADGSGNVPSRTDTFVIAVPAGHVVSATATREVAPGSGAAGTTHAETSEFSAAQTVVPADATPPTLANFSSSTAPDTYGVGAVINVTATMSEPVQAGAQITVTLDTGDTVVLTAAANGTTLTGTYVVSAGDNSADLNVTGFVINSVLDLAGNAMVDTTIPGGQNLADNEDLVIDTTAPAAPVVNAISTDTGVAGDEITTDQTLLFSGTAEANATVSVYLDAALIGTTTADGAGAWSFDYTGTTLAAGSYNVTATATDAAGNVSGLSAALPVLIDTTAPAAPVVNAISTDTGVAGDEITTDQTLLFSGTAEANATVSVYLDAALIGTTTADGAGAWSFDYTGTTLAAGSYNVTATATDAAGNVSGLSAALPVLIDTTAPAAPVVNAISTDTGVAGDEITTDQTLLFSGTAEANATVSVYLDAALIGTTTADGAGAWSFDYTGTTLAAGSYNVTATATDAAGNVSGLSAALPVLIDTTAPAAPVVNAISTDTGVAGDEITTDQTLLFSGTAEANATVSVYLDAALIGTTTADGAGAWSFDYTGTTLAAGSYNVTATATDAAGNVSGLSAALPVLIDTTAPAAPVVNAISTDTGVAGDEITTDQTLLFSGTAEANATVSVYLDAALIGTTTADGAGAWSFDYTGTTLAAGSYNVTATATDAAGNVSGLSAALPVLIDTTAPAAPVVNAISTDTGVAGDEITTDQTLLFSGTAEANATVSVYLDAALIGTTTADGAGAWSFDYTGTTLAAGSYNVTATATDAAGNVSGLSAALPVLIDTTAPAAPSTPDLIPGSDSGVSNSDDVTNDTTPTFVGTAEAGSLVSIYDGAVLLGTTVADGAGNWSFTAPALADGVHNISATATDAAGNLSPASGTLAVTIDNTAPAAPTVNNVTSPTALPVLTGTAVLAPGETLTVSVNGATYNVVPDAFGNWTLDLGVAVPASGVLGAFVDLGVYPVSATVTDLAGNATNGAGTVTIAINDAPVVTTSGGALAYVENDPAAAVDLGLTVSDIDNATLASATIRIAGGYVAGEDSLAFVSVGGIAGSWDGVTGTLSLTGPASTADWQTVLRSVAYQNASENPNTGARTVSFLVNDGALASAAATATVNVTAVNDAPTLTANTLAVGDGATVTLGLANLGAADVDNAWATLAYAVTTIANGQFELAAAPGVAVTSFTAAQIAAGQVRFVHDGSNLAPSYAIEVTDGSAIVGPFAATIVFNASAAAPPVAPPVGGAPEATPLPTADAGPITLAAVTPAGVLPTTVTDAATGLATMFLRSPSAAGGDAGDANFAEAPGRATAAAPGGMTRAEAEVVLTTPNAVPDGRFGPLRAEAEVIDTKAQLADAAADTMRGRIEVGSISDSFAEIDEDQAQIEIVLGTIRVTGIALSVGAVWWAARAAGLVASLLTTTPAWRHVDPLPVLGRDPEIDDEDEPEADEEKRADEHRARWVLDESAA